LPLLDVSRELRRFSRGRRQRPSPNGHGNDEGRVNDTTQVVVYASEGRRVGLIVGSILDIVEEEITTRSRASRRGVLYTAVVQGGVTESLDVDEIIRAAREFAGEPSTTGS